MSKSEDLKQLRSEIDCLDDKILQALIKRMQLSDQIISSKNGVAAFRPGREAVLVRQLIAKSTSYGGGLAPEAILGIWRQIMAASLNRQNGEVACAVHKKVMPVVAWHMGSASKLMINEQLFPLIEAVASGQCQYALVPADEDIETLLACLDQHHQLKVIARTPLYEMRVIPAAFIIANYLPDMSGDDISLFARNSPDGFNLLKIEGHYEMLSSSCVSKNTRLIGGYAR
ncbi:chorismate mutase [Candidatus Puniceispirillum sp.]|nr:chorismate mutase [Candidatus Puniceispirillum sp.]